MKLGVLLTALALSLPACTSSSSDMNDDDVTGDELTSTTIKPSKTHSFAGELDVLTDNGFAKVAFTVTNIDWNAMTATWNTSVLSGNGMRHDIDVPATIALDRCPGCFNVIVEQNDYELVDVELQNNVRSDLVYWGLHATSWKITKTSKQPTIAMPE